MSHFSFTKSKIVSVRPHSDRISIHLSGGGLFLAAATGMSKKKKKTQSPAAAEVEVELDPIFEQTHA